MNRLKKWVLEREIRAFEKGHPQVKQILDWLNDPEHPGRKRGIAAACIVIAGGLRGIGQGVKEACEKLLIPSEGVCSFNYDRTAEWIGFGGYAVYDLLVPGVTLVGMIFGVWGLLDARRKGKVVEEQARLAKAAMAQDEKNGFPRI